MFRASLLPSSGEQEFALPHLVFCTGSDSCGCVELGRKLCALWTFTVHTVCAPAPHNHSHHYQCRTPYAAVQTLVLLTMGIMMPETCWDKRFDNKHQISCILLVSLSSPYVHDAWSQEPKILGMSHIGFAVLSDINELYCPLHPSVQVIPRCNCPSYIKG